MWFSFAVAFATAVSFLYIPGVFFFRAFKLSWLVSLVCAPVYSLLSFCGIAGIASAVGITSSWAVLVVPSLLIALGVYVFVYLRLHVVPSDAIDQASNTRSDRRDWPILALYVGIALIVVCLVFIKNLDGPSSFLQEYDNTTHLSVLRTYLDTGDYSFSNFSNYPDTVSEGDSPWGVMSSSLYPALWHTFTACVISLVNCPITLGVNAVDSVLSAIVFPAGIFLLIRTVFQEGKFHVAGALATMSFAGFPWAFLLFGPLYPNLLSFSLLPVLLFAFISMLRKSYALPNRLGYLALFVASSSAVALAQPNAIFTAAVFLIPFCCYRIVLYIKMRRNGRTMRMLAVFCFVALVLIVWFALYEAPFMQSIVGFTWPATASKVQAAVNALTLSFTAINAAQLFLGFLVIMGCIYSLIKKEYAWMTVSYLLVIIMYIVNVSTDGSLKHILTGFWYTDTYRIGAMVAIFGIPVASMGIVFMFQIIETLFAGVSSRYAEAKISSSFLACLLATVFLVSNFWPSFTLPGRGYIETGFGAVGSRIAELNSASVPHMYDSDEIRFIEEVKKLISEDSVVINEPNDGSVFLYALDNLNIFYRTLGGYGSPSETQDSLLIRSELSSIAIDDDVRSAVENVGAEYVLILDQGEGDEDRVYLASYNEEDWVGIESVTDDTPGFEVVLAEGDMRLYRIVA